MEEIAERGVSNVMTWLDQGAEEASRNWSRLNEGDVDAEAAELYSVVLREHFQPHLDALQGAEEWYDAPIEDAADVDE